jgi:hypothetical protein
MGLSTHVLVMSFLVARRRSLRRLGSQRGQRASPLVVLLGHLRAQALAPLLGRVVIHWAGLGSEMPVQLAVEVTRGVTACDGAFSVLDGRKSVLVPADGQQGGGDASVGLSFDIGL